MREYIIKYETDANGNDKCRIQFHPEAIATVPKMRF